MTTTIIAISILAWILLSAFFVTAACVLSARLRQHGFSGDDQVHAWARNEGEIPTRPVGDLR